MTTLKEYLDYAELAQAAYGDDFTNTMTAGEYKSVLTGSDVEFSTKQAEEFATRYEVVAVADPYLSGLDAVLFRDMDDNVELQGYKNSNYILKKVA
ncbi:MAG: hypothetical protein COB42_08640 [Sulfurimonas sp.]|nr:MAG: hypothetical protein COB42_08640 [Sulfurimonas sp.]